MRPYLRKIVICFVPVLLSIWAIWYAWEHDRFKLGVDLSGGTILVYEIDLRKAAKDKEGKEGGTPHDTTNLLAESLKRRIDPNDLYNIVIRPAGEGRVEIILPTGGPERAARADAQWRDLIQKLSAKVKQKYGEQFDVKGLNVPRGRVQELAERIQHTIAESTWEKKLYANTAELKALFARAEGTTGEDDAELKALKPLYQARRDAQAEWDSRLSAALTEALARKPASPFAWGDEAAALEKSLAAEMPRILKPLEPTSLRGMIEEAKKRVNDFAKEREVEAWFKAQAWNRLVELLWEKLVAPKLAQDIERAAPNEVKDWAKKSEAEKKEAIQKRKDAIFADRKAHLLNTLPDSFEELAGRAVVKGGSIAQAFVETLQPVMGSPLLTNKQEFVDRGEADKFITDYYGPSLKSIQDEIEAINKDIGRGRDLTVEEVQRIKELISKVGKLEFRILANKYDDEDAIKEAGNMITRNREKLDDLAKRGEPPPAPTVEGTPDGTPKAFELTKLARGARSKVTYSWVELGRQERLQLHLDNAAQNDPGRGGSWSKLAEARANQVATTLPIPGDIAKREWLQGALFYSRECKDRNLPEEERTAKKYEYFVLARNPEIDPATGQPTPDITGDYLSSAGSTLGEGRPAVSFNFNAQGGRLFHALTEKNVPTGSGDESTQIKRHLAIILDSLVVSAPTINSAIGQSGQITGNFTPAEVKQLVDVLRAGALPATLKTQPVSESTMGATLGRDTIEKGVWAVIYAFIAVVVFMILYYRFSGLVACVALLANLLLTVGFMVATGATFTLPGLAGLVLTLGMAVDANVLIYERLREERERGASLSLALRNGYDRAFPTIIDTHLTSIFVAIVLYIVGNDQLKGFGVSLTVGLIISLFTSLYMTRLMFDIWEHQGWLKKLSMFKLFSKPDIDFMAIRHYWFTATIILTILGMALFIGRLPNDLNIDFVGGTAYAGQLKEPQNIDQLRHLLSEDRQHVMLRPEVKTDDDAENRFEIRFQLPDNTFTAWRPVTLANRPEGETPEQRRKNVEDRARVLPDASVEQIFSSADPSPPGLSRLFNVRTSEKEPELVQVTLDQLLKDNKDGKWVDLLKTVKMNVDTKELPGRREVTLKFTEPDTSPKASPGAVKEYYASPSFVRTLINRYMVDTFQIPKYKGKEHRRLGVEERLRDLPFQMDLVGEEQPKEGRFKQMKLTFAPLSGNLTAEQIDKIRQALAAAETEFNRRPPPERLETFDSQLAAETRLRAMYAILLSWGAILVYLWFRFGNWTFGLATVLCLIHDLFFTLGLIAAGHYLHGTAVGNALLIEDFKLDLTAVAALLTLVGYSVNDTIVVFDRIREVRGKNPELTPQMINDSVNQTLSRTLLTAFTVWLVVFVIYVWGGPGLHLFSFVMLVGVIVGTYSSIYIASPLLLIFGEGARATAKGRGPAPAGGAPDVRIQSAP
jgi:SecD/SecF fusion protein